ncbi:MAG: hypothetical protein WAN60_03800 [Candidatus Sulfotelmatobacter sp.]
MPGAGRPGDPLWGAIGFAIGVIPGIYFHQVYAGLGIGLALAVAFALIREDMRRGYRRPTDPTRFMIGLGIGLLGGVCLHYLELGWRLGMGLGLAFGLFLGAALGVSRADTR